MSLSVTALLASAVQLDPMAVVDMDGARGVTVRELDQRSRDVASGLLSGGLRPGSPVRVPTAPGLARAVALLAAWRAGFVVHGAAAAEVTVTGMATAPAAANLLDAAEGGVWSETPAVVDPSGATFTHADLLNRLCEVGGPQERVRDLTRLRLEFVTDAGART